MKTLLNNNETVISNTLGIAKEGVADLSDNFKIVITEIKRRTDAELNEEYYREFLASRKSLPVKKSIAQKFSRTWKTIIATKQIFG